MHLAVSSGVAMTNALGPAAAGVIAPLIERYSSAVSRTRETTLLVLDDAASMAAFGMNALVTTSAEAVRASLAGVQASLNGRNDRIESVLLFGGDRVFPFFKFVNPVVDRVLDPDPIVLSDNPYSVLTSETGTFNWLVPSFPVGRVPDSGRTELFAAAIQAVIRNHESPAERHGSCAVFNAEWIDASTQVAQQLVPPLDTRLAPPYQVTAQQRPDLDRNVVYVNLHGFDGETAWKAYDAGTDRFLDVITPASFSIENASGTFLISEACYGGQVAERVPANSCALSALAAGATVIAATGLVWGSVLRPWAYVQDGDALAALVIRGMGNRPIGEAFTIGRQQFVANCGAAPNPFEQKTALQFILLGDPTLQA